MAASAATRLAPGARWQTGSVARAFPVKAKAWQRQPPKSISRRAQDWHGSAIQAVPRKALKAGEFAQMSASECSRTDQNSRPGIDSAAWQGETFAGGGVLGEGGPPPAGHGVG